MRGRRRPRQLRHEAFAGMGGSQRARAPSQPRQRSKPQSTYRVWRCTAPTSKSPCAVFLLPFFYTKAAPGAGVGGAPGCAGCGSSSFCPPVRVSHSLFSARFRVQTACAPTRHADPGSLRPTALTNFRTCQVAAASARVHGGKNGRTADTINSARRHVPPRSDGSARRRDLPRTHCIASTWSWWR